MKDKKVETITCPVCGREYLPAEIYVSGSFFGNPQLISRDSSGKIESYSGGRVDTTETYVCDNCNARLKVSVKFRVDVDIKNDFSKDYTSTLYDSKLTLSED